MGSGSIIGFSRLFTDPDTQPTSSPKISAYASWRWSLRSPAVNSRRSEESRQLPGRRSTWWNTFLSLLKSQGVRSAGLFAKISLVSSRLHRRTAMSRGRRTSLFKSAHSNVRCATWFAPTVPQSAPVGVVARPGLTADSHLFQLVSVHSTETSHYSLVHSRISRDCARPSQLLPEPNNGGCRVQREILRVATHQGSRDCCTHLRVGEEDGDSEGNVMTQEQLIFTNLFNVSNPHKNSRIQTLLFS